MKVQITYAQAKYVPYAQAKYVPYKELKNRLIREAEPRDVFLREEKTMIISADNENVVELNGIMSRSGWNLDSLQEEVGVKQCCRQNEDGELVDKDEHSDTDVTLAVISDGDVNCMECGAKLA